MKNIIAEAFCEASWKNFEAFRLLHISCHRGYISVFLVSKSSPKNKKHITTPILGIRIQFDEIFDIRIVFQTTPTSRIIGSYEFCTTCFQFIPTVDPLIRDLPRCPRLRCFHSLCLPSNQTNNWLITTT